MGIPWDSHRKVVRRALTCGFVVPHLVSRAQMGHCSWPGDPRELGRALVDAGLSGPHSSHGSPVGFPWEIALFPWESHRKSAEVVFIWSTADALR
jgi:hypothetical protein